MKPSNILLLLMYAYMQLVTHQFLYQAGQRGVVMPAWKHAALVAFWPVFYGPIAVGWDYE